MTTLESVKEYLPIIDEEINTIKTVVESNFSSTNSPKIPPLCVFFSNENTRNVVASVSSDGEFEDVICRISEVMNLYPLTEAYAATISLSTTIELNDEMVPAVNIFVISFDKAWSITVPFNIVNDTIFWLNDDIHVTHVDDLDIDPLSREMVSMFYLYVNITDVHFTLPQLLSYLSTMDTAINFIDQDAPSFFDFSNGNLIQV